MCKHILNAQVSIRAPCCQQFFDCPECHYEKVGSDHKLLKTIEMIFICKKCKRAFRKDLERLETEDEYCPHCDNHFVIEAKTPTPMIGVEGEDARMDNRMLKDDRIRYDPRKDWSLRDSAAQESERIDEGGTIGAIARQREAMTTRRNEAGETLLDINDEELDWS